MGDLDAQQQRVREHLGAFLDQLEVTPMTRSYRMLVLQAMLVEEIVEWRLAEYLHRNTGVQGPDRFVCRASHAGGRPILFLPDRSRRPGIPEGWQEVVADGVAYQANFVKVALNVMQPKQGGENVLPTLLRGWFGEEAGKPGRTDAVEFERKGSAYVMRPVAGAVPDDGAPTGPVAWRKYTRDEALDAVHVVAQGWDRQVGIVDRPDQVVLFVTLDKRGRPAAQRYEDRFLSPTEFQWQSQNRNTQQSELGQKIRHHQERGVSVHLFVRRHAKLGGTTQPFLYAGTLEFQRWEGERPITVWWRMEEPVPEGLRGELRVGG